VTTVSNGCVQLEGRDRGLRSSQHLSVLSEQDRSQVVLEQRFNGDKTYDNQTGEIQPAKNYL